MTDDFIIGRLKDRFEEENIKTAERSDLLSLTVSSSRVYDIIAFLKDDPSLGFSFLTDLTGIHYPDAALPFGVVYHLHQFVENKRIRIKTFLPGPDPVVKSLTDLYPGANWMERETYDYFGIIFEGHPNLKRILNVDYMDYFPMRKEYPLEDQTREDKDDRYFGR